MVFWEGYVSDEVMGTFSPIAVYWLYAGLLQLLPPLDNYRLHTRKEEDVKNAVPLRSVVKGVLLMSCFCKGQALQFNWLFEKGAFVLLPNQTFSIDFDKIEDAVESLSREILTIQAKGDKDAAQKLLEKYGQMTHPLTIALEKLTKVQMHICNDTHSNSISDLSIVPYSQEYSAYLAKAAELLRKAADFTSSPSLKRLLHSKADAFLSNDYYDPDIAWMELDSKLDVTIGPYETYEDVLFGYKATFEAFIVVRDDKATTQLKLFGDQLQVLEQNLPMDDMYKSKDVISAPIRVIHSQHHRLVVPYAIGALYNHPLEGLLLDTVGGAISFLISGMTARTAVIFFCFATVKTVDDHCGLLLPGNLFHMFFQNNTAYHDVHHQLHGLKYNFSQPFFPIWDKLLGTYMPYDLVKRAEGGFEARL